MSGGEARAQSYADIAGELVRRGRLSGDAGALAPTVAAAVRADSRRGRGERARFRHVSGGVALTDWYMPRDAVYRERDAIRAAERQRSEVRRAFLRKIAELPPAGFAELIATWLSAEGVSSLRGVRRPTSSSTEMHFAGVLRKGHEETRVAILVLRDVNGAGRELARERVIEMRGSLHHYGSASLTWILTLGQVPRATREEAQVPGTTPVAIWDGFGLAEAMEARRIGLVPVELPISSIDLDLLDALRGQTEAPMRDWARGGGERGERGERSDRGERGERREGSPAGDANAPAAAAGEASAAPAAEPAAEAAPPAEGTAAPSADAQQGEGGRRRRRRRRRRGGADGQAAGVAATGEAAEAESDDEGDEDEAAPMAEATTSTDTSAEIPLEPEGDDDASSPERERGDDDEGDAEDDAPDADDDE
jgi:hypothetical protein